VNGRDRPDERRTLEDSTAARLAEIVAAAESAAKGVIDDAEAEARRRMSDADAEASRLVAERIARVEEVADRLADQAEALKRGADELIAELARAKRELGAGPEGFAGAQRSVDAELAPADGPARKSHLTAVTVVEGDAPESPEPTEPVAAAALAPGAPTRNPAGARLLATQMAVSGSSREEIDRRLRNGFEIEDTAPILDAILGPEGAK
jgi:vacuolar-type H+-ATPase subunit H